MPRVVNCPASDYSSSEDDDFSERAQPRAVPNTRPPYYRPTDVLRESYLNYNYSHNMPIVNFKEDEVYCITRIIGGKVRKFKKDSRTWLHKSSERAKRMGKLVDVDNISSRLRLTEEPNTVFHRINDNKNCMDISDIGVVDQKTVRFQGVMTNSSDFVVCGKENCNERGKRDNNTCDLDEDYMFIGDSDADLTYSEEESPVKAASYVDISRHGRRAGVPPSRSADEIHTRDLELIEPLPDTDSCQSLASNRSLCQEDSSFEHLDLCNESGNSIRSAPTVLDVSRKLAPALEVERESYLEVMLDCAVNKPGSGSSTEEMRQYCGEIYRKTRSRQRTVETSACPGNATKQPTRHRKHYNTRSANVVQKVQGSSPLETRAAGKRSSVRKPCKRLRVSTSASATSNPSVPDVNVPTNTHAPRMGVEKPEAGTAPSSSDCYDNERRTTPSSLFIIAGFVLYGMFKANMDRQWHNM